MALCEMIRCHISTASRSRSVRLIHSDASKNLTIVKHVYNCELGIVWVIESLTKIRHIFIHHIDSVVMDAKYYTHLP